MLAALRSRSSFSLPSSTMEARVSISASLHQAFSSSAAAAAKEGLLDLQEVETVLSEVKADDVKVRPANKHCEWADFMVLATGRSTWHVKNIAQALIYKAV